MLNNGNQFIGKYHSSVIPMLRNQHACDGQKGSWWKLYTHISTFLTKHCY